MIKRVTQTIPWLRSSARQNPLLRLVILAQAVYYIITGIWPLVSINTFQKVTGPKHDLWLVKTLGVLITVIGGVLAMAGMSRRASPEIPVLAIGSAAALTGVDVVYVAKGRISPIYLLDALGEVILIGAWVVALRRR
jgi:hypothetical protein